MLGVKKQIPIKLTTHNEEEYLKNQNDIKNSIKNLYIGKENKKKNINEYAQLVTQIREEYAKLQNKNTQLENTLQKYKDYIENKWTTPIREPRLYRRPIRKTKYPYYQEIHGEEKNNYNYNNHDNVDGNDDDNNDNDDNYDDEVEEEIRYIKPKKTKNKKRIVYIDEIDGGAESEEEPETNEKLIVKKLPAKKAKKDPKKPKIGIMKSI